MQIRLAADLQCDSIVDGEGIRTVVWTQGCPHNCKGCHNPSTHPFNGGTEMSVDELINDIKKDPLLDGVTFSGGDPLYCNNREFVGLLAKYIKENYPEKDIWLYTGYTLRKQPTGCFFYTKNEEFEWPYLKYIDILVDGPFDCDVRKNDIDNETTVKWRGSSNQRVIVVKDTLKEDYVVCRD